MRKILFVIVALHAYICIAQPGTLDLNFGSSGNVFPPAEKFLYPFSVNCQPNKGNIITAGYYRDAANHNVGFVGRYDFYGNPISSFGTSGVLAISNLSTTSQTIYYADFVDSSSENFYIRGTYKDASNATIYYVSRYLDNGTLDSSFGTGGTITGIKAEIHNGYIYSVGLNSISGHQYLKRYTSNGILDASFSNSEFPFLASEKSLYDTGQYDVMNFQADGKIILSGYYSVSGGINHPLIGRFNADGTIDTSFGVSGFYTDSSNIGTWVSKTQSDGKIVCLTDNVSGEGTKPVLMRLNSNGTLDTTYGVGGYAYHTYNFGGNFIDKLIMQSDNSVAVCGSETFDATGSSTLYLGKFSSSGIQSFWRNDLPSVYSENWDLKLISDSYALTFGMTSEDDFAHFHPVIQRVFLKYPVISLYKSNDNTDVDMTSADGTNYTVNNVFLTQQPSVSGVKFRLDHQFFANWGNSNANPTLFPSGIATMGESNIGIPTTGNYNVTFNIQTGAFSFTNLLSSNLFEANAFKIFPNPASKILNIQSSEKIDKVIISDMTGKVVFVALNEKQIDLFDLSKGMYILEVFSGDQRKIEKFIKE